MTRPAPRFTTPTYRARRVARDPFLARLGLLAVAALVVTPILAVVARSNHHEVVDAGQLPGAAVAVGPASPSSTIPTTTAPAGPVVGTVPATVTPLGTLPSTIAPPTTAPKPTTTAKAATAKAATAASSSSKSAAATTAAPKPTTTPAPPPSTAPKRNWGQSEVVQLIRDVWPDELEEHALFVAHRESSFVPTAYNGWCCYGLFQIYFNANKAFLATVGVTAPEQLLDPFVNTRAAYALYQRSGWAPWGG
jgi:hypothetical protein